MVKRSCAFCALREQDARLATSKTGAAATTLPCGEEEPTKASDLDIYNGNENDGWAMHSSRSTGSKRPALMAVKPCSLTPVIPLTLGT